MFKALSLLCGACLCFFLSIQLSYASGTDLVAKGSSWKYLDDGTDQSTAWQETGFDDSAWQTGAAQLGYGDGDETTVVGYGPDSSNKYITTYFRKHFNLQRPQDYEKLECQLLRDDGAVIYLNGTEVVRDNMPGGVIDYQTRAHGAGNTEGTFLTHELPLTALVEGDNVIAVEVHQATPGSSDLSFDLGLAITRLVDATHTFTFVEGSSLATPIGQLNVYNPQADTITYNIQQAVPFVIDANGKLFATSALNQSLYQTYHFAVEVSNTNKTVTTGVSVTVIGINC